MLVEKLEVNVKTARELYRKYKEHQHYSEPIDREVQRAYQLLAQGRLIIKAIESIKAAGVNEQGLPKLAICPATDKSCYLTRNRNGAATMSNDEWQRRGSRTIAFREACFEFPVGTFPFTTWEPKQRSSTSRHIAQVPLVPIHLRPKRGLRNYHVLWEAEWSPIPAKDPYLLRRIGRADMWLVVAMWDLTEVERAALASRIVIQ